MLEENVRDASRNDESRSGKINSRRASGVMRWQNKSPGGLKNIIQSPQKRMGKEPVSSNATVSSPKSQNVAEVESLTKNAIRRSIATTYGSESSDYTESSESSADNSEKKRNRLRKIMSGRMQTPPTSPTRRERTVHNNPEQPVSREISEWARERGRESYQTMKHAGKYGNACIMEKCYVLVGCRPDEHVLLLGPLQQLVNAERKVSDICCCLFWCFEYLSHTHGLVLCCRKLMIAERIRRDLQSMNGLRRKERYWRGNEGVDTIS